MEKVNSLSLDQEAQMKSCAIKTLANVFEYEFYKNSSHAKAIDSFHRLYQLCKLDAPIVLLLESPLACQYAASLLKAQVGAQVRAQVGAQVRAQVRDQVGAQVWDQVWDQVGAQVWDQVWDQVGAQVWDQVWDQVGDQVGDQVWDQVWAQVWAQVRAQVGAQVRDQVWDQVRDQVWDQVRDQVGDQVRAQVGAQVRDQVRDQYKTFAIYGNSSDLGWTSFYSFFKDSCGIALDKYNELKMIRDCAEQSFLCIQLQGLCIVSKYPNSIKRDEENRLHCINGYAVQFSDGYGQYYIHGRAMPSWIFAPFTKEQFISETNEDVKAGMYEVIEGQGEGSMLSFLGAGIVHEQTFVHANGDTELMQLYKTEDYFDEEEDLNGNSGVPLCWLKLTCPSTMATYLIPSDSSFQTCEEAAKYARPDYVSKEVPYKWFSRS
jgi:hypothetical protein